VTFVAVIQSYQECDRLIRSQLGKEASLKATLSHEAMVFDSVCGVVAMPTQPALGSLVTPPT
jgi:hypothetical protein